MKLPSYFATLKILFLIIFSAMLFFIARLHYYYNFSVQETLNGSRVSDLAVIVVLLTLVLFVAWLINSGHNKEIAKQQLLFTDAIAKFQDTLLSIDDPFFALNKKYEIIYCNEAFRKMTGSESTVVEGKNLYEIFRQLNSPAIHQNFVEVFETGNTLSFELYDYFFDNWKDVNITAITDGVSVIMKDASLRKKYETELKTAMQFLEETNTTGSIGGWELDVITGKVNWTPETCNIHEAPSNYTPDLKNALSFYKAGYSRETITHTVKDSIENGSHWDKMLQIVTLTGKEKWVRAIGRPQIENGEVVKLIGSFQDVQQQKMLLDKLTEKEERFTAVFEHSTNAKLLLNIEEEILEANAAFINKTGYNKKEITGIKLAEIKIPGTSGTTQRDDLKWQERTTLIHKTGALMPAEIMGAVVKDRNGIIIYFLLNINF